MGLKRDERRVVLITGCSESTSLGAAFTRELLKRGWRVFATARKIETLEYLQSEGADILALDVTSDESVEDAAKTVAALTGGRLDLLLNNAGVMGSAPVILTDPKRLAAMHDLHVLGPLRLVQAFFPHLSQTATAAIHTKIVNIGSVIGNGAPWHAAYASTKAGIMTLSDIMRREMATLNVDVITVELALVRTAMTAQTKDFPLERPGPSFANSKNIISQVAKEFYVEGRKAPTPEEVSRYIVDAVEKPKSPPKLWHGRNGFLFKWVYPYLPVTWTDKFWDSVMHQSSIRA